MAVSGISTLRGADGVGGFLRLHRAQVVAEWQRHAGRWPWQTGLGANPVDALTLVDGLVAIADSDCAAESALAHDEALATSIVHALGTRWDLRRVLIALSALRDCIARVASEQGGAGLGPEDVRMLHASVDRFMLALGARSAQATSVGGGEGQAGSFDGRFRATFDGVPLAIGHMSADGRWLHLNQGFCRLFGYSCEELRGLTLQDLTHPDDVQAERRSLAALLDGTGDESLKIEKRCLRKDGATIWVDATVSLIRDANGRPDFFVVAMADVTAPMQLRMQLRFLAEAGDQLGATLEYRKTLENIVRLMVPELADWCALELLPEDGDRPECVAVAHRDAARIELVRKMRRLYPPRVDDPRGVARVLRTGEPELIADVQSQALEVASLDEGSRALVETLGLRSAMVVPLAHEDRIMGALCLANAESDRHFTGEDLRFAQELARRVATAIQNARLHEALSRAVDARDQVLGIVSHDLRNPLNTIELGSGMLLKNAILVADPSAHKQLQMIRRSARRATRLISDLLDMSGIQAGKLALSTSPCDLTAVVAEAIEMHEPMARDRAINLRSESDLDGHPITCDRDRILQVLSNLVGNALKFCSPGDTISVGAHGAADVIVLTVSDTGPGIPGEALAHVFELYWKGSEATRGSGLGLFISKGIIEAHGGRMRVVSQFGAGTTFEMVIPRRPPAPIAAAPSG